MICVIYKKKRYTKTEMFLNNTLNNDHVAYKKSVLT